MNKNFSGKVALVTGAASGIGRACALAFAQEGARVVVTDVDVERGEETVSLVRAAEGEGMFFRCDVSRPAEVEALFKALLNTYDRLDYACNNAGIAGATALTADYPEGTWNRVLAINLTGAWLCMKYEIPQMLKQGGGSIVNMASILGTVGFAAASAYVTAKHGLIGLTKTAALEYATQGIRVNAVCPGFIYTPMLEQAGMAEGTELYSTIANLHPVKRLGKPEEVARVVTWLCSDAASFITGDAVLVDGGYVAQ
jgi:NAD(P)-dependent dehydrogenase (short-subunit alcohol dehydrogenase family)